MVRSTRAAAGTRSTKSKATTTTKGSVKVKPLPKSSAQSKPRPRASAKVKAAVGRAAKAAPRGAQRGLSAATRRKDKTSAKSRRNRALKSDSSGLSEDTEGADSETTSGEDEDVDDETRINAQVRSAIEGVADYMRLGVQAIAEQGEDMRKLTLLHNAAVLGHMEEQSRLLAQSLGASNVPVISQGDGDAARKYKEAAQSSTQSSALTKLLALEAASQTVGEAREPKSPLPPVRQPRYETYVEIDGPAHWNEQKAPTPRSRPHSLPESGAPVESDTDAPVAAVSPTRRSSRSPKPPPARYRDED